MSVWYCRFSTRCTL